MPSDSEGNHNNSSEFIYLRRSKVSKSNPNLSKLQVSQNILWDLENQLKNNLSFN